MRLNIYKLRPYKSINPELWTFGSHIPCLPAQPQGQIYLSLPWLHPFWTFHINRTLNVMFPAWLLSLRTVFSRRVLAPVLLIYRIPSVLQPTGELKGSQGAEAQWQMENLATRPPEKNLSKENAGEMPTTRYGSCIGRPLCAIICGSIAHCVDRPHFAS